MGSRVLIETVILDSDSDSLDGDDFFVLSKLFSHFKKGGSVWSIINSYHYSSSTRATSPLQAFSPITPSSPQLPEDTFEINEVKSGEDTDDDYIPAPEDTPVPEETLVPNVTPIPSCVNQTPKPPTSDVPRASTIIFRLWVMLAPHPRDLEDLLLEGKGL